MSDELVTDARVEFYVAGSWMQANGSCIGKVPGERFAWEPMPPSMSIPHAIDEGRAKRRYELQAEVFPDSTPAAPIRVIDSAGNVVQQWGRT